MNTPEVEQLYRRYQRYDRVAKQYNAVLDEREGGHVHLVIDPERRTLTPVLRLGIHVVAIPKTLPRDRPTAWYVEKYCEYQAKAENTRDLYWVLKDAEKKQTWEALDREGKLAQLQAIGERLKVVDTELAAWLDKVPAWRRQEVEREPPTTPKEAVLAWIDGGSDPRLMIELIEEMKRECEAERDWLLERL
jgi:hypothetical protein